MLIIKKCCWFSRRESGEIGRQKSKEMMIVVRYIHISNLMSDTFTDFPHYKVMSYYFLMNVCRNLQPLEWSSMFKNSNLFKTTLKVTKSDGRHLVGWYFFSLELKASMKIYIAIVVDYNLSIRQSIVILAFLLQAILWICQRGGLYNNATWFHHGN